MDGKHHRIENPRFENLEPLLPALEAISRFCGEWRRDALLEPAVIKSLKRMVIAASAGASTRIEGARLNNRQAMEVILSRKKLYEERSAGEVLGYSEALSLAFAMARKVKRRDVLSPRDIKRLHGRMMRHSEEPQEGRSYRSTEVNVSDGRGGIMLVCALPDLVPAFMEDAVRRLNRDWRKGERSRLAVIAEFIAEFLAIHPFEDGNGRCARLLTIMLLKMAGHDYLEYASLEEQIEKYKLQYYLDLNRAQKTGVMDGWFRFFLMTLGQTQAALRAKLKRLGLGGEEPPLAREILRLFRLKSELTAGEIVQLTHRSPAGIRKALAQLTRQKSIRAYGRNRGRYYRFGKR